MALPLLGVCLLGALVLVILLEHTGWHGLKLMAAVFVVLFGVETFLTQLETLFFNLALHMPSATLIRVVLAGAVRALLIAPLAVLITWKVRSPDRPENGEAEPVLRAGGWITPGLALAAVYLVVYILFGYFVAWQSPEVRAFYTGSTDLQPFFTHVGNQFILGNPLLGPFQLFRGCLWAGLALLIVQMVRGGPGTKAVLTALVFGLLVAAPCLIPNPYLPAPVRMTHFIELVTSMLLFGALAGWLLNRRLERHLGARAGGMVRDNVSIAA